MSWLKQQNLLFSLFWRLKTQIKVPAGLVSGEVFIPVSYSLVLKKSMVPPKCIKHSDSFLVGMWTFLVVT